MTKGSTANTATPTARDEFWYDSDGNRFLGRETWNESGTLKTLITYYAGHYQAVADPALGGIISETTQHTEVLRFVSTASAYGVEYMLRDHLGSVMVSMNSTGAQTGQVLSFDPFGGRRSNNWQSDVTNLEFTDILDSAKARTRW